MLPESSETAATTAAPSPVRPPSAAAPGTGQATTVRFQLTRADYTRLSLVVRRRQPASLRWGWRAFGVVLWLACVVVGVAYFQVRDLLGTALGDVPAVAKWLGWGTLFLVFVTPAAMAVYARRSLQHGFSDDGDFLSPRVLRFDDRTLVFETRKQRVEMAWTAFVARDEDAHNCYLFLEPAQAVIVPKAALASVRAQFDSLYQALPLQAR